MKLSKRQSTQRPSVLSAGLLLLTLLGATACAQVSDVHTADGRPAKLIGCQGAADDLSTCYAEAKLECPAGYKIWSTSSDLGDADDRPFTTAPIRQHIVVSCTSLEQQADAQF